MNNSKKVTVIIGHYGSGKTEFAMNYALKKKCKTLVDLDIVNPYFRSSDLADMLENQGVHVISPQFARTNVEVPSISGEVYAAFEGIGESVFDVGGDDDGAIVLGRFNHYFKRAALEVLMVVNINRPLTADVDSIKEYMADIEAVSRLKITGLVNNTNIMGESTVENLLAGQEILEQVGLPIKHISGIKMIIDELPEELKSLAFPLDIYITKPWERND